MTEKEWVTLLEVNNRLEAEIIKDALEAQGIPAAFFQEGAAQFGYALSVGPLSVVEICVPSDRLSEAQTWLEGYQRGDFEETGNGHEEHGDSDNE